MLERPSFFTFIASKHGIAFVMLFKKTRFAKETWRRSGEDEGFAKKSPASRVTPGSVALCAPSSL
jgi:hypothetical protein